jgi:tetratricopeptide (TPR) repeat protein
MNGRKPPFTIRVQRSLARLGERLAALGAALVWPIEWLVGSIGRAFFALSERLNHADSLLLGIAKILAWPFLAVGRLIRALGAMLLPERLRHVAAAPFSKSANLLHRTGAALWSLTEKLNLDGLVLFLVWITKPLWRPLAAVGGFVFAWLATRRYRGLLWGLPAVLLLLPIVAAATWGLFWGRSAAADRYKVAVRDARESKDYERMQLFEKKLANWGVETRQTDYATALALADEGKLDEAYQRMQRLAPEDRPTYAPAHAWILQNLLSQKLDVPQAERMRLAGVHLKHLQTLGVRGRDIDFLHAIWLAQSERPEEASDALAPLINSMPYAAIERLRIDFQLKRTDELKRDARAVRDHMEDAKRKKKPIEPQQFQAWAVALEVLGEQENLGPLMRDWHAAAPDEPIAKRGVAIVESERFDAMLRSGDSDPRELADRCLELADLTDSSSAFQVAMVGLYKKRSEFPNVKAMFNELAKSPKTPLGVLDAVGTAAALDGDIALARDLLKRVVDGQPDNAVAWNNYGWALSQDPDKDLGRALAAANHALAIAPQEFRFRETRGQINLALQNWADAVKDLEFALNGMPDSSAVHQSLAKAYDALGQADLAQMHRNQVQQ